MLKNVLHEFSCCATDKPDHFIEDPKLLSCGHCICTDCTSMIDSFNKIIKCGKCGVVNELDMIQQPVSLLIQSLIKDNLKEFSEAVYEKLKNVEIQLNDQIKNLNSKLKNQFELIESEIEIRIESMKSKLDDLCISLKKELFKEKKEIESFNAVNLPELEKELKQFNEDIEKNSIEFENFKNLNKKLVYLSGKLQELKKLDLKVDFNINEKFKINECDVGSIYCSFNSLEKKLENAQVEHIKLNYQPRRVVELKYGRILACNYVDGFLTFYTSWFDLLRKIEMINNETINSNGIARDDINDKIFVSSNSTIYMLDDNLSFTKSIEQSRLKRYGDICFYDRKLYACVGSLNCIEIFDLDLNIISEHYLEIKPLQIRLLNDIACIQASGQDQTCFFKLPSFEKLHEYDFRGPIFVHSNNFYMYSNNTDDLKMFDRNGKQMKPLPYSYGEVKYCNSSADIINNCLLICLKDKEIAKIKLTD